MRVYRLATLCVLCSAVLLTMGCGGDGKTTHKVTGTVKFSDGSPLTKGTVVFASDMTSAQGGIQSDGSYALGTYGVDDGAPAGSYKVFLTGPIFGSEGAGASEGEEDDGMEYEVDPDDPEGAGDSMDDGGDEVGEALVNKKFNAPDTSGLTCEVTGSTTFDITVEKP